MTTITSIRISVKKEEKNRSRVQENNNRKVLIVCDMFPPAFAPRMGYLCKYLRKAGWQPVVVTEWIEDHTFAFLKGDVEAHYVRYFPDENRSRLIRQLAWLLVFVADLLGQYKSRKMAKVARSLLKSGGFMGVLSSAYRTFPLPVASRVAKEFGLPLVADHRDIIEQYASDEFISRPFHTCPCVDRWVVRNYRDYLLRQRNKALRQADWVTTVSPWHVEQLRKINPHVSLIYNGYDPEIFYPKIEKTTRFRMTYTGRVLSLATRDPRPLFEALARLDQEKRIAPETFRVVWYVDADSRLILEKLAEEYAVPVYMEYPGYVPADQVPQVLWQSSISIQLANKADEHGPKGIMSTKLFEALATERPLLCVRSDESYLERTIQETHSGVAARDAETVYRFILEQYAFWEKNGYTRVQPDRDAVTRFSRQKQAEQFMDIFTKLNQQHDG